MSNTTGQTCFSRKLFPYIYGESDGDTEFTAMDYYEGSIVVGGYSESFKLVQASF